MYKTLAVAFREFKATVLTKAFIIGVLLVPAVVTASLPLAMSLVSNKSPEVLGTLAVIDRSGGGGLVTPQIQKHFTREALAEQLHSRARDQAEKMDQALEGMGAGADQAAMAKSAAAMSEAAEAVPTITPEVLATNADVEGTKQALLSGTTNDGSRLALVVIDDDAVTSKNGASYGSYQLFVKPKLDSRAQRMIGDQLRKAVVNARLANNGQDPARILAMTTLREPPAVAVTKAGEKSAGEMQQVFVPLAFMMLLWVSVFTGGQFLMTSTIEEKSSRVMEVLLSAVSPMELMTGKILGQMSAGLLILLTYSGLGITALFFFRRSDLLEWLNLGLLVVFFFIAFITIASMMAAIGSAVTDIHEAQALLMPVMLVVMIPMLLMMPIIYNPNGKMATIMSFMPPISPFVMVLRLSSSEPPPLWQPAVAVLIGALTVYAALRITAKIFKIGVLMYGKPPNFATLMRWVREA